MPVIINEVTTQSIKPVAPAKTAEPPQHQPADGDEMVQKTLASIRRAEARAERLRAD